MTEHELINEVTSAVRDADVQFDTVGGSSRHWVRDCFLPALIRKNLAIVHLDAKPNSISPKDDSNVPN